MTIDSHAEGDTALVSHIGRLADEPRHLHHARTGRWVVAATVLGSGIAFLDGTVVNVAPPTIGDDLDMSLTGLQWTINAYLVTLSALLLLGGSLGDRFGRRRIFIVGLADSPRHQCSAVWRRTQRSSLRPRLCKVWAARCSYPEASPSRCATFLSREAPATPDSTCAVPRSWPSSRSSAGRRT